VTEEELQDICNDVEGLLFCFVYQFFLFFRRVKYIRACINCVSL
jgi:hypothetical protein